VVPTLQGIGAPSSGLVAGLIVDNFGYKAAFGEPAVVAVIALAVLVILMPETATHEPDRPSAEDQTCRELAHERSG
jgi:predicted MFS family arabinose efflux permease